MRETTPATYGGPGWVAREETSDDEIRAGKLWAALSSRSDSAAITDLLLYCPSAAISTLSDNEIDGALQLRAVDAARLKRQFDALCAAYEALGVRVHKLPNDWVDDRRHPNSIFLRDLFWATPFGAIIARMASPVRAGEERAVSRRLAELGMPIALTISGSGLLETADCHWLRPGLAMIGVGERTNAEGCRQLREWLEGQGVDCIVSRFDPQGQHLTGCLQAISDDRILIRPKLLPPETMPLLRKSGFELIPIDETEEVLERYAFNFVVVAPDVVLLPSGCPEFRAQIEAAGIRVAAEVEISEYIAMAGGPCCASGVLARA